MRIFKPPIIAQIAMHKRVWRIENSDKIYLTFDDGPTASTLWVLDFLKEQKIKATFFCVGDNVVSNQSIYQRILDEGHQVGNHTMRHENLIGTKSSDYIQSAIEASNHIDSKLFRPPYGRLTSRTLAKLPKDWKVIMWSWLSYDFDLKISNEEILEKSKLIQNGDILVFHDNEKCEERLKFILPKVVEKLKKSGFEFAKIDA